MRSKSSSYYRANPLSDTELVVGGLVTAAIVGIGSYLIYQHYQTQAQNAQNAQLAAMNAALPASQYSGTEASQIPQSAFSTAPSTATPPSS